MHDDNSIGTLRRVPVREVFSHEAYDFTTWLERHPDALSAALGIDLADMDRERTAGAFRVDLFAEDGEGRRIIIENQLEATDHKHLGQVLTYLSFFDADVAVWIAADARPEHVSAVSWLNQNATGADFYLVRVEGVQIDDSRAAPLFTRIVGPSEETRAAGQQKKELDEQGRLRRDFYTRLLPISNARTQRFSSVSPTTRSYISASAGRGFEFLYRVQATASRATVFIDFRTTQAENDAAFNVLLAQRDEIDEAVQAGPLTWTRDENRRREIALEVEGGYRDQERWAAIHEQLVQGMVQLERAVVPRIEKAQRAAQRAGEGA